MSDHTYSSIKHVFLSLSLWLLFNPSTLMSPINDLLAKKVTNNNTEKLKTITSHYAIYHLSQIKKEFSGFLVQFPSEDCSKWPEQKTVCFCFF